MCSLNVRVHHDTVTQIDWNRLWKVRLLAEVEQLSLGGWDETGTEKVFVSFKWEQIVTQKLMRCERVQRMTSKWKMNSGTP